MRQTHITTFITGSSLVDPEYGSHFVDPWSCETQVWPSIASALIGKRLLRTALSKVWTSQHRKKISICCGCYRVISRRFFPWNSLMWGTGLASPMSHHCNLKQQIHLSSWQPICSKLYVPWSYSSDLVALVGCGLRVWEDFEVFLAIECHTGTSRWFLHGDCKQIWTIFHRDQSQIGLEYKLEIQIYSSRGWDRVQGGWGDFYFKYSFIYPGKPMDLRHRKNLSFDCPPVLELEHSNGGLTYPKW